MAAQLVNQEKIYFQINHVEPVLLIIILIQLLYETVFDAIVIAILAKVLMHLVKKKFLKY